MINFPNNPTFGDAFTLGGTIYTCVGTNPIVWNAAPAAAGIPDAPTDGKTYGRNTALWKALDKTDVGLDQVDNTADYNKPVSGPQGVALEPKIVAGGTAQYWRGDKTWQVLDKNAVQLGNVDNTADLAKTVQAALYLRAGAVAGGALMPFNWSDDGSQPPYLWGGTSANGLVYLTSRVKVGAATNADYANNSGQVTGIGGWAYRNDGNNPAYLWCSEGDGQAQHLTTPGALSVNYAGTSGYCSGTAEYSNRTATINGASGGTVNSDIVTPGIFSTSNGGQAFISNGWNAGSVNFNNFLQINPSYGFVISAQHQPGVFAGLSFQLGGNEMFRFRADGNGTCSGNWSSWSDIRLKENILPITDALTKIKTISGYTYTRNDVPDEPWYPKEKRYVGLIAQEVEKILPEAVTLDEKDIYALNYNGVVALLVNAVNELSSRLAIVEAK